jgi:pimeloyl-ACP methyl ester carboxylesterase
MQWRRLLVSGGAALGGVAAYNLFARRSVATLPNPLGGEEGWSDWRGHRLAYTVHGSGPPVLLLHSIGYWSWSYEWRHSADVLAQRFTVYTLDLLGFGRSDRPAIAYTPRLYLALVTDFARRVVRAPVALVGAGLSGVYAVELAATDPAQFPLVALVAPTGLTRLRDRPTTVDGAGRRLVNTPVIGTATWNNRVTRRSLDRLLDEAYYRAGGVTAEQREMAHATTHQPGAKHAPSAWLANQLNLDVRPALRRLLQPGLLVWGAQAELNPAEESFGYRALKRDLRVAILDRAGEYPHDERPDEFNEVLADFLGRG